MKNFFALFLVISILSVFILACGWKPKVSAVPLTAPWDKMNLPVKENAVVWKSDPNEFRAVHKEDKRAILKNYTDALKSQGWTVEKFDESGDRFVTDMKKGGEPLRLEVYDFDNTGVVIKTGAETGDNPSKPTDANAPKTDAKIEKADFTVTSEELDKEYTRKGVKSEDLEKYVNKNIAVTGRVSMIVTEKKGRVQPWVTLYAPGTLGGVNCYFDDGNVEQMKLLKMDKVVKVQGFQDSFIVPGVSPDLKYCVVLEGAK